MARNAVFQLPFLMNRRHPSVSVRVHMDDV